MTAAERHDDRAVLDQVLSEPAEPEVPYVALIDVEADALALAKLQEQRDALDEAIAARKAALLRALPDGTSPAGALRVSITRPETLDADAFAKDHPADAEPDLYRHSLSVAKVRARYAPEALADYLKHGRRQVRVI